MIIVSIQLSHRQPNLMKNSTEPTLKEQGKETIPDAPEEVGLSIPYAINVWPKYPVNSCSLFPFNSRYLYFENPVSRFFSLEYPRIPSMFYPNIPHPITPYEASFLKVRHTVTAAVWERGTKSELEWEVEIEYIFRFLRVDSKIQTTKVSFSGLN